MAPNSAKASPWWYRRRGILFTAIYILGFVPLASSHQALFTVWGNALLGAGGPTSILWVAVVCALAAWLLRASGTAYLRRDVVFAANVQSDRLIVAGPFRFVRNPLYLGNMFLAVAVAVLAAPLGSFIIVAGNIVLVIMLAGEEARLMRQRYGSAYDAFHKQVPAFIPRLTPVHIDGVVSVEPHWVPALLGEGFNLGLAVALVPLALLGEHGVTAFWAIFIPSSLVTGVSNWWVGRRRLSAT